MLVELRIKNFAIIDELSLSFGPGLNVFTGETGAGKSIIIDAVSLVLGDRAAPSVVRTGEEEAEIEALFDAGGLRTVDEVLKEAGIPLADSVVIKRVVSRGGRSKAYVNGSLATLVTLNEVGRRLIDVYGQSEHQSLTRPDEHIEVLDAFAGLGPARQDMGSAYRAWAALKRELDEAHVSARSAGEKRDYLAFVVKEITEAALKPGEEEELKKEKDRLTNFGKIKSAVDAAERALYSDAGSAMERLGAALRALREGAAWDEGLKNDAAALESCMYQFEEVERTLRGRSEVSDFSADAVDGVMARLDLIGRLKKKYGADVEAVIARGEAAERELDGIVNLDSRIKDLASRAEAARREADAVAARLTSGRRKGALELKKSVEGELKGLGMKGAVFEAVVEPELGGDGAPRVGEKGSDRVSFYLSANPGEETRPLARIASGGELSRIMLALKRGASAGRVPTLIFDEIDAGIGGVVADAVGVKLKEVAASHQVICITHLAQIAAFASTHYAVAKRTSGGRTFSSVAGLNEEERVAELSRMLAGANATDTTRKQARELMEAAAAASSGKGGARKGKADAH